MDLRIVVDLHQQKTLDGMDSALSLTEVVYLDPSWILTLAGYSRSDITESLPIPYDQMDVLLNQYVDFQKDVYRRLLKKSVKMSDEVFRECRTIAGNLEHGEDRFTRVEPRVIRNYYERIGGTINDFLDVVEFRGDVVDTEHLMYVLRMGRRRGMSDEDTTLAAAIENAQHGADLLLTEDNAIMRAVAKLVPDADRAIYVLSYRSGYEPRLVRDVVHVAEKDGIPLFRVPPKVQSLLGNAQIVSLFS